CQGRTKFVFGRCSDVRDDWLICVRPILPSLGSTDTAGMDRYGPRSIRRGKAIAGVCYRLITASRMAFISTCVERSVVRHARASESMPIAIETLKPHVDGPGLLLSHSSGTNL